MFPARLAVSFALVSLTLLPPTAATCTEGSVAVTPDPVVSVAESPDGDDLYFALRDSGPVVNPRTTIERRHRGDLFLQQLYVTDAVVFGLRADDEGVYFVQSDGVDTRVLRLPREGGAAVVLAAEQNAFELGPIELDGDEVYWMRPNPYTTAQNELRPARIVRVPKLGGTPTIIAESLNNLLPWIGLDGENVYYAARETGTTSSIFRAGKTPGLPTKVDEVDGLASVALSNGWLYEALSRHIQRIPAAGGAPEAVADLAFPRGDSGGGFAEIVVVGGQVVARQSSAVARGCLNDWLVFYSPGAPARLLSDRAGVIVKSGTSVLHVPKDCFLIGDHPPFTVERFCTTPQRRRAAS